MISTYIIACIWPKSAEPIIEKLNVCASCRMDGDLRAAGSQTGIAFRESSFLGNRNVPQSVRTSRLEVSICKVILNPIPEQKIAVVPSQYLADEDPNKWRGP